MKFRSENSFYAVSEYLVSFVTLQRSLKTLFYYDLNIISASNLYSLFKTEVCSYENSKHLGGVAHD